MLFLKSGEHFHDIDAFQSRVRLAISENSEHIENAELKKK